MEAQQQGKKSVPYGREEFMEVFRELRQELIAELPSNFEMPAYVARWIDTLVADSVPGGKLNRGLTVVHTLQALSPKPLSAESIKQAAILGWCIEWLQAFFLVADDIMDSSLARRGEPCWYLKPSPRFPSQTVALTAINDAFILEAHVYRILRLHFRSHPNYIDLVDLFHECSYQTELGQLLDLTSQPSGDNVDLSLFTMDTYIKIVRYKTAFYSFYLPVALGVYLSGHATEELLAQAKSILIPMGEFFQIQDDYLDCYGDPKVIGKIGQDIEEKKCGWLVCQALLRATDEQKELIKSKYGKDDAECVRAIKALYKELNLEAVYKEFEEKSEAELRMKIEMVNHAPLKQALCLLLGKIYKRSA